MRGAAEMQPGMESCSCYSDALVTRTVLNERGVVVGIVGLKQIFEQLYLMGRQPDGDEVAEELLAMVKTCNLKHLSEKRQRTCVLVA